MVEEDKTTEEKILEAAKEVFIRTGKAGARMQEIADEAGINKALLHYYYRTKEKLFEAVFSFAFKKVFPRIKELANPDIDVFGKIEMFCDFYINLLQKNPFIPIFVLEELSKNPKRLSDFFSKIDFPKEEVLGQFEKAMEAGLIRRMDPKQIIVSMISMCIFPFVAKPIVTPILFDGNKADYKKFIESRKKEVPKFIIESIKIK